MEKYLTIKEAASLLGVTPQTLRNWEQRGELIPYRNPINNYRLYRLTQVEKMLNDMQMERLRKGKFKIKVVAQ